METAAFLMLAFIFISTFVNMYMTYRCQHNYEYMHDTTDRFKERLFEMLAERAQVNYEQIIASRDLLNAFALRVERAAQSIEAACEKVKEKPIPKVEGAPLNWRQKKKLNEVKK